MCISSVSESTRWFLLEKLKHKKTEGARCSIFKIFEQEGAPFLSLSQKGKKKKGRPLCQKGERESGFINSKEWIKLEPLFLFFFSTDLGKKGFWKPKSLSSLRPRRKKKLPTVSRKVPKETAFFFCKILFTLRLCFFAYLIANKKVLCNTNFLIWKRHQIKKSLFSCLFSFPFSLLLFF